MISKENREAVVMVLVAVSCNFLIVLLEFRNCFHVAVKNLNPGE